jgi:hypothetical protein
MIDSFEGYSIFINKGSKEQNMKRFIKFSKDKKSSKIQRFTVYRDAENDVAAKLHNKVTMNPSDKPQYEGVIFSDGSVVLRWLTEVGGSEFFNSIEEALKVHGHPEYETEIIWHDGPTPKCWSDQVAAFKKQKK